MCFKLQNLINYFFWQTDIRKEVKQNWNQNHFFALLWIYETSFFASSLVLIYFGSGGIFLEAIFLGDGGEIVIPSHEIAKTLAKITARIS